MIEYLLQFCQQLHSFIHLIPLFFLLIYFFSFRFPFQHLFSSVFLLPTLISRFFWFLLTPFFPLLHFYILLLFLATRLLHLNLKLHYHHQNLLFFNCLQLILILISSLIPLSKLLPIIENLLKNNCITLILDFNYITFFLELLCINYPCINCMQC